MSDTARTNCCVGQARIIGTNAILGLTRMNRNILISSGRLDVLGFAYITYFMLCKDREKIMLLSPVVDYVKLL